MAKKILKQTGLYLILLIFLINFQVAFNTLPDSIGVSILQYALLSFGCSWVFLDDE